MTTIAALEESLGSEAVSLAETAKEHTITTAAEKEVAGGYLREIKQFIAEIESDVTPLVKEAKAHHSALVAFRKKHLEPLQTAEKYLKEELLGFTTAEEIRYEEERTIRESEAETFNAALVEAGAPPMEPPVVFTTQPHKVEGVSVRRSEHAVVTDLSAFLKALTTQEAWHDAIKVDGVKLTRLVKTFGPIEGVELQEKRVVSARIKGG